MNDDKPGLVWGAKAIADYLDISQRRAFYLLENNLIPAEKIGKSWVSTRAKLRDCVLGRLPASSEHEVA
jgi:hypothetical protein